MPRRHLPTSEELSAQAVTMKELIEKFVLED